MGLSLIKKHCHQLPSMAPTLAQICQNQTSSKKAGTKKPLAVCFFFWVIPLRVIRCFCSYLFFFPSLKLSGVITKATQDVLISNFLVGVTRIFLVRTATNPQWNLSSTTSFWGSAKLPLTSFAGGEGAGSDSVRPEFARAEKPRPISWLGFCRSKKLPLATGIRNYWGRGEFSVVGLVWWCGFEEISIWIMYIYIYIIYIYIHMYIVYGALDFVFFSKCNHATMMKGMRFRFLSDSFRNLQRSDLLNGPLNLSI